MKQLLKKGISLPEVVGIFAMLGVLCGAVMPHLINVRKATQLSKLRFNLQNLRQRIDDYRNRHGKPPEELTEVYDHRAELKKIEAVTDTVPPPNPVSRALTGLRNRVKKIDSHPPSPQHITKSGTGGWLYNPATGGVWADNVRFVSE